MEQGTAEAANLKREIEDTKEECERQRACVWWRVVVRRRQRSQTRGMTSACMHCLVVLTTEAEDAESAAKLKAEIEALKSAAGDPVSPYLSRVLMLLLSVVDHAGVVHIATRMNQFDPCIHAHTFVG